MMGIATLHPSYGLTFVEFTNEPIVAPNNVPMTPVVAPIVVNLVE